MSNLAASFEAVPHQSSLGSDQMILCVREITEDYVDAYVCWLHLIRLAEYRLFLNGTRKHCYIYPTQQCRASLWTTPGTDSACEELLSPKRGRSFCLRSASRLERLPRFRVYVFGDFGALG